SRRPVGDARASHSEAATECMVWSATGRIRRGELVAMDRFTGGLPFLGHRRGFFFFSAFFFKSGVWVFFVAFAQQLFARNRFIFICRICSTNLLRGVC